MFEENVRQESGNRTGWHNSEDVRDGSRGWICLADAYEIGNSRYIFQILLEMMSKQKPIKPVEDDQAIRTGTLALAMSSSILRLMCIEKFQ
jgi:hypothetical protein